MAEAEPEGPTEEEIRAEIKEIGRGMNEILPEADIAAIIDIIAGALRYYVTEAGKTSADASMFGASDKASAPRYSGQGEGKAI